MNVIPYRPEHLLKLQLQEGQAYGQSMLTPELAASLVGDLTFTAMADGEPIAVGGVTPLWENRALAWTFIGENAGPHFVALHRAVRRVLDLAPYRRIEADTPCEFEQGHRWLRMLGFNLEAERMAAHRPDGGDSALYAKVKPWR